MNKTDLSVIIPVYNAEKLIKRTLDSVLGQVSNFSFEIICIDDGSTDFSLQLIQNRHEQNIRLLRQPNSGPAAARNRGIQAAQGNYIAFLDADDYWLPGFINKTLSFLSQHPDAIAVSVAQRHITVSGDRIAPASYLNSSLSNSPLLLDDFFSFWAQHNHVCTGSIVIRADIARQTGGQRPELRICEDLEFWGLIATYGKIGFIPEILFVSDGNAVTQAQGWLEKNRRRWASAPAVNDWKKRITARIGDDNPGFQRILGRVAKNLVYSIMLSGRSSLAYREAKMYRQLFPHDKLAKLLSLASLNPLNWKLITAMLKHREYNR